MIRPFAVDPGLLKAWSEPAASRFWRTQFLRGQRRAVAAHPNVGTWKHLIRQEARRLGAEAAGSFREATLTELVQTLLSNAVVLPRDDRFDSTEHWLENAVAAHRLRPTAGVLTHRENFAVPGISIRATEFPPDSALWEVEPIGPVERTSSAALARLEPLLEYAKKISFIDPYFDFNETRFAGPMLAWLGAIASRPDPKPRLVEIVVAERGATPTSSAMTARRHEDRCFGREPGQGRSFASRVPANLPLAVRVLAETAGSDSLHDRFVLTDIGGVQFTVGLDTNRPNEFDGGHLLDGAHLRHYEEHYISPCRFKLAGTWRLGAGGP